jgi:hypothetical protein
MALVAALSVLAGAAYAADRAGVQLRQIYPTQPLLTGDLEVGLGIFHPSAGSDSTVFTTTTRVNVPHQGSLNFEIQTSGNAISSPLGWGQWVDAYGHAWQRLPSSAWGAFGGTEFVVGTTVSAIGAEAKHYFGNISVGGDVAYLWSGTGSNAWELAGAANLYLNPNFRVGFGAQSVTGFSADIVTLSIDAEVRLPGSPWSIWGYASSVAIGSATSYVALGGFKLFLDAPNSTLQSHEKDVPFWFHSLAPLMSF